MGCATVALSERYFRSKWAGHGDIRVLLLPCVSYSHNLLSVKVVNTFCFKINGRPLNAVSRGSSVGIATRYGLDCQGIESRWGRDSPHPSRPVLGVHLASYTLGTGSVPVVKCPGRGVYHPSPSSAGVKERVELYSTPPLGLRGLL